MRVGGWPVAGSGEKASVGGVKRNLIQKKERCVGRMVVSCSAVVCVWQEACCARLVVSMLY